MNMNVNTKWVVKLVVAVVVTASMGASVRAGDDDKPDYGKLGRELRTQYNAGNYEAALKTCEKMHEMRPDNMENMYNMACLHCLVGHKDKAYEWLQKAIDAGYRNADELVNDGDFSKIRGEDKFRAIVRKLREADGKAKGKTDDGDDDDKPAEKKQPEKKITKVTPKDEDEISAEKAAEKIQELTQELIDSAEAKDYDKSLKLATEAYKLSKKVDSAPLKSMTAYNMACMYSLKKEPDEAFKYLEESLELGGGFAQNIASQIENDTDLNNIRKDERFAKIMAKAKKQERSGGSARTGRKVESKYELRPPKGHDKSAAAPLLVVLHGYGENMKKAKERWAAAADKAGAVLLTVQGGRAMSDGVYEWGQDMNEIEEALMGAIDAAMDQYKIDKKKIVIGGFSQGGWIAYGMALRNPDTFRGIIPVAGICKPESDAAFKESEVGKLRVYIIVGKKDEGEVLKSNEAAAKKFEKAGAAVSLNEMKNLGHEFPEDADTELSKAVEFVLRD